MHEDRDSSQKSKVSVIIIAYKRENFLLSAVKSVINQTARDRISEIVVVKNFENADIDKEIYSAGGLLINSSDLGLGGKVIEALTQCTGDIVSFLEDDDLFEEGKVEHVLQIFDKMKICYYHNSVNIINEEGNQIPPGKGIQRNLNAIDAISKALIPMNHYLETYRKFEDVNFNYNLSSLSVKRELLDKFKDQVSKTDLGLDWLFHILAISTDCGLYTDSFRLTQYRSHAENSTLDNRNKRPRSLDEIVRYVRLSEESLEIMYSIAKDLPVRRQRAIMGSNLYLNRTFMNIFLTRPKKVILRDFMRYLRHSLGDIRHLRFDVLLYGSLSLISKSYSKDLYRKRHGLDC